MFNQNSSQPEKKEDIPDFEPMMAEDNSFWRNFKSFIWETVKVVVISLAIIVPIRYYLIQPFYVKGASMEPSFHDHEYLIIDEISYRLSKPQRGDIVVFRYPKNPSEYFIKRVIALSGENIKIQNGQIYIRPVGDEREYLLDESAYLLAGTRTNGEIDLTLEGDELFVLGDNRSSSLDSRSFGPIHYPDIIGKTWLRGWPFDKITVFKEPNYNYVVSGE